MARPSLLLVLLILTISVGCVGTEDTESVEPFDVIIRGGRVLDGSGNPWVTADVAFRGDRIVAVGDLGRAVAHRVVDADGLFVSPGFIDTHSHAGGALETQELSPALPLLAQGITTVAVNPDGGGVVNIVEQRGALEAHGLGVNTISLVPHGSVRRTVMGMDDRGPTAQELERMGALVRGGMEAGAYGLSSGLFYTPGNFAQTEELVALARVVSEFGGVYQSHVRDEATYTVGVLRAVEEVIRVAEEGSVRGVITHIKALGPEAWGMAEEIVASVEAARSRGVEVFADQYPYIASSTGLKAALVPAWAQEGGDDAMRARFQDPEGRREIRAAMVENLARRGGAGRITLNSVESDSGLEGRTLASVADALGIDAVDAALELLSAEAPGILSYSMREEDLRTFMVRPWTITASDGSLSADGDGLPHPRSYGTFPRKLATYARDLGVLDLADAIRTMTSLPAAVYRIEGRGSLRPGAAADVVVFDVDRLADRATFEEPRQLADGIVHLWVNGVAAIEDGHPTGALGGRALRKGAQ